MWISRSSTRTGRLTSTLWVRHLLKSLFCPALPHHALPSPVHVFKRHAFSRSVLNPDNSYEMFVDQSSVSQGSLLQDVVPPVNPLKEIDDPTDSKPQDWDERAKIPDPEAVKPDDW